ncbi:MGMT family protein [Candidatus Methylacidiphilum infernorum]|uniref:MGMT family protein n=1 Tax=Candidatus Methylacidiphilum infernorum TaxID=511746 RepID=A0ABX7PX94_9BACT|nr:MGMT family protein [Candidatus Methylacidiphilum infernorum]QSR87537.1 MGMT family protein [Candidatus Methylacidiphilum infernorum]
MDSLISKRDEKKTSVFSESALGPVQVFLLDGLPFELKRIDPNTPRLSELIEDSRRRFPLLCEQLYRTLVEGEIYFQQLHLERLPPFYKRVLQRVKTIPKGTVKNYGEIAAEIGSPHGSRAVGSALARNPLPLLIPCHRVVKKDGALGSFSMGGSTLKAKLLEKEGIILAKNHKLWIKQQGT